MGRIRHQAKGTRVLRDGDAELYLSTVSLLRTVVESYGYRPVILPNIDGAEAWDRPDHRMFGVTDSTGSACGVLVPERTDQVRRMVSCGMLEPGEKVYYCERCYRHDQPQANRYREFTQFGVEWIGATPSEAMSCIDDARKIFESFSILHDFEGEFRAHVDRGSAFYSGDTFECHVSALGASSQVLGGGRYDEGFGWAIGVERLIAAFGTDKGDD